MLTILSLSHDNLLDYAIASGCMQSQLQLILACLSPCMILMVCSVLLCIPHKISLQSAVLQADFIVPSSREAIDCDSAWNELLREQVPNLFLQSLQSFKQLAVPTVDQPMAWVNRWLQSVPLPREVCFELLP